MTEWFLPALAGLAAGVLSAWGVGGGTLLLLCMTLLLGVEQREAQAINLLFFLPTAAAGLFLHSRNGYLDGPAWRWSALPGAAAALAAALLAGGWDTDMLRAPFGVYLLYAGGSTLWDAWRQRRAKK